MNYTPQRVLKHELGHNVCRCDNEDIAWSWALGPIATRTPRR